MSDDGNVELERFREQWKEEVTARSKGPLTNKAGQSIQPAGPLNNKTNTADITAAKKHPQYTRSVERKRGKEEQEDAPSDAGEAQNYHDLVDEDEARRLGAEGEGMHPSIAASKLPSTALDHYEKAVEREEQGNLGDSVSLYRKAYRLDAGVDKIYRNKHFPPSSTNSKSTHINPSNAPVTVPNTAHHSLDGPPVPAPTVSELIASFADLSIPPAPPPTDQSPPPPCPISSIPTEILINILDFTATLDVAAFVRLSLVCKHFAHLVASEDRIWKRVCLSLQNGFAGMHYDWNCSVAGEPLPTFLDLSEADPLPSTSFNDPAPVLSTSDVDPPPSLPPSISPFETLTPSYPNYRTMFRSRPRIRFNGCYISTVNYIRPGASSSSQISWNTPVHIVTYYRYLRFFRDGSCVSLLTTSEPVEVVHHLTKANLPATAQHGKSNISLLPPMSIMQHALRGRWELQSPLSATKDEPEGTVSIETLGIDRDKYTYIMSLALRSSGRKEGTKNNKLVWRGFWSYNKLTDDWAEFGLKNDKPFFWSRVSSYGMGE